MVRYGIVCYALVGYPRLPGWLYIITVQRRFTHEEIFHMVFIAVYGFESVSAGQRMMWSLAPCRDSSPPLLRWRSALVNMSINVKMCFSVLISSSELSAWYNHKSIKTCLVSASTLSWSLQITPQTQVNRIGTHPEGEPTAPKGEAVKPSFISL